MATFTGTAGNDIINGTTSNDIINGLAGNDILNGLAGNDSLSGGTGNDTLYGEAGNDTLDGGAGVDRLEGGIGNDMYIVDNASDQVIEAANAGTDTVQASVTYTLANNVENLTLTGSGYINGTGNALANTLTGNSGHNTLNGGAGNDTLSGGAGNDTLDGGAGVDRMEGGIGNDLYVVDNASDQVIEAANAGTDTVQASVTYTLTNNVENLTLTGSGNINGTGNALANTLTGNNGHNTLNGGAGNDPLSGGAGNDTLSGGAGADKLTGGAGADPFAYTLTTDSLLTSRDSILDFTRGQDKLDLSQIDANTGISGDQAFTFIGSAAFSGAGQVRFDASTHTLFGNVDNNTTADFAIDLAQLTLLTASDFIL